MVGTVNSVASQGFEPGELLLNRIAGRQTSSTQFRVDLGFAFSPNETGLSVGSITVPTKRGWDYLWVRSTSEVSGGQMVVTPKQVNIERVYRYEDWAVLEESGL